MSDLLDKKARSERMSRIRSSGNKSTELRMINLFKEYKITGWRRHYPVKGHPDFVFINERVAVFVDGCFWHGHGCRKIPEENSEFWRKKIEYNKKHDNAVNEMLKGRGWQVYRIWECKLKKKAYPIIAEELLNLLKRTHSSGN